MVLRQLFQAITLLFSVFMLSISSPAEWIQSMPLPINRQLSAESSLQSDQSASLAAAGSLLEDQENSLPEPAAEAGDETALAEKETAAPEAESRPSAEKQSSKTGTKAQPETKAAAPEAAKQDRQPAAKTSTPKKADEPAPQPATNAPAYRWGSSHQVSFRTEVQLTNTGSGKAEHIWVDLPLLENKSPYQKNNSQKTNYAIDSSKGRMASFYLDSLEPGEAKTITVDYQVTLHPVSLSSTNNSTVEKARKAYQEYAGSGNCRTLASGFVKRCGELGVTARLVNGYTRPQRALLAPGSLQGCRHSWAEFYIDDLGWVPVDLTFGYFADFPYASHIVECYDDLSVHINYLGGKVEAVWNNMILP